MQLLGGAIFICAILLAGVLNAEADGLDVATVTVGGPTAIIMMVIGLSWMGLI